jgi:hypothetical protein
MRLEQQRTAAGVDREDMLDKWPTLTVRERRLLLGTVIDRVTVSRGEQLDDDTVPLVFRVAVRPAAMTVHRRPGRAPARGRGGVVGRGAGRPSPVDERLTVGWKGDETRVVREAA